MDNDYGKIVSVLMRGPLSSFASVRADTVRELRKDGKSELASRVAALRKPSLTVWALNQTGQVAADDLDALRSAGDRLRHAQEKLLQGNRSAAAQMSEATDEQRRAIELLSRRLGMVLTAAGHAASQETLRRISDGLRNASIADPATWSELQQGRLLAEPEPVSFPTLDVAGMHRVSEAHADHAAEAREKRRAAAAAEVRRAEELEKAAREQEEAARQRRQQATEALRAARTILSKLEQEQGASHVGENR